MTRPPHRNTEARNREILAVLDSIRIAPTIAKSTLKERTRLHKKKNGLTKRGRPKKTPRDSDPDFEKLTATAK